MYAKVIIEYPIKSLDKAFTYIIKEELKDKMKVGMKVLVPFGNKLVNGFVMSIMNDNNDDYELKEIKQILEPELILNNELLDLGKYMHDSLLCTYISAYQTMLPSAFKAKNQKNNYDFYEKYIILNKSINDINEYIKNNQRSKKQISIIEELLNKEKVLKSSISGVSLNTLLDKEIVKEIKEQKYRISYKNNDKNKDVVFTSEQESAYQTINKSLNKNETFLLYGVTGSGKTEIYLKLIDDVIKSGKSAIMLVPEISLTMQIVNRFYNKFGDKVAVLHSGLSDGERHDEYLKVIRNEVSVVVGTRSAIYAPFNNLGIIIMDEEHSESYKQENNPKYHTKDIADFRCKYHNIPLVLGSATPRLESMARALKGVYTLITLKNRIGSSVLPKVSIVNMEEEYKNKNFIFSELLQNKIRNCLDKKEQIILLLNRRGFSTFISCSNCGFTYKCPNCDISLTYHKTSNNLICHYCGYQVKCDNLCPICKENGLKYLGLGTEKLEEEIKLKFPSARVIRMDQDSTSKKGAHDRIITDFKDNKYDILLGTSMISKGLDFPNVTLVGVINADASLNAPDFRSNENTFSLLNQVAGRAGRREKVGEVIIQTFNPDNRVLNFVKENSYDNFYKYEMDFRKKLRYPPYYYLIGLKVTSNDYKLALEESKKITSFIKKHINEETICLGPTTAAILKFNNLYRFQIIIKYRFDEKLISTLKELDKIMNTNKSVNLDIDINPIKI